MDVLVDLLHGNPPVVLSGAGVSTASGIPDYRGPTAPKPPRVPIQYSEFVGSAEARRRYWARSMVGWPKVNAAEPNVGHRSLAQLEAAGLSKGLITQNVDGLHQRGGSEHVIELHGALREVRCLGCGEALSRATMQDRLLAANPPLASRMGPHVRSAVAPDGDADIPGDDGLGAFVVPECQHCRGILKPDVVFFGESVPRPVVDAAWTVFNRANALLVVGSSLTVFSGYRFVREAAKRGMALGVINLGPTRGDAIADVVIEADLCEALPDLVGRLVSDDLMR